MGSVYKEYFDLQEKYEKKYGSKTVVAYQLGSFYEIYSYHRDSVLIGNAPSIGKLLNFIVSRKNKKHDVSFSNPIQVGIHISTFDRHLKIIVENGWTVICVSQESGFSKQITRTIDAIYSPSTYIEDSADNNYACCIFAVKGKKWSIGFSIADLSTGETLVDFIDDLEDLYRITEMYGAKECVCLHEENVENLKTYISCASVKMKKIESIYKNIEYQNEIFGKIYNIKIPYTYAEHFNIEKYPEICVSLSYLLQYCYEHNAEYTKHLKIPRMCESGKLIIHNNALNQLNVINCPKSLYDIVNYTSTGMGTRLLKKQLCKPETEVEKIVKMYDSTSNMNNYEKVHEILENIADIEKLHKKMQSNQFQVYHLETLYNSYIEIIELYKLMNGTKKDFENYVCSIEKIFEIGNFENPFREGNIPEIDKLYRIISQDKNEFDKQVKKINKLLDLNDNSVKVEKYIVSSTPTRVNKCVDKLKNENYRITKEKTRVVIHHEKIDNIIHKITNNSEKLENLIKTHFNSKITEIHENNASLLESICQYVANIDVTKSKRTLAEKKNYTRPVVKQGSSSYIQCKNLRHPIIESLDNETEYIGNDVSLIDESCGILLYGVNGVGKSCLSKAIGLSLILAQSGHFVPCNEFTYVPFNKLYTRINGNDNLYKGQSSFFVEMQELNSILKSDNKSLVLGDEVCRGTEDKSALAIVSYSVKKLLENKTKFIFATHLHDLPNISILKNEKFQIKHLQVTQSLVNNSVKLSYDRKIMEGHGDVLYGIEVANAIIDDPKFSTECETLRKEILNAQTHIVNKRKSKYNSNVIVNECQICKSTKQLETHHIIFQKDGGGNKRKNLVVLCELCHTKVHSNKIRVDGWIKTTYGKELKYTEC
jgi:DNA mismatch repair protein MutS